MLAGMATLVVAHRTLPRDRPENSLAGIRYAAEVGADVVEVDARRARDGVPVLLHDPLLARTTGVPLPVRSVPSSFVARLSLRRGRGEHVPTLAAALEALAPAQMMAIDTKDPGAAPAVLDVVIAAGALDRVLLWSQHEPAVRHYATNAPTAPVALLRDARDADGVERMLRDAVAFGAGAVSVHETVGTPEFVESAHARGIDVFCSAEPEAPPEAPRQVRRAGGVPSGTCAPGA
jgi:glycerophosphoryl diester phosphodiesterase